MARKSANVLVKHSAALEELALVAEAKYELAEDVFTRQDEETRKAIVAIKDTLKTYSNGTALVHNHVVAVSNEIHEQLLMWLAVEIAKDLAFSDIQVAGFTFPKDLCAECGATVKVKRGA